MRDELISFQQTAVSKLLAKINSAAAYHKVDGRPQVIAFHAPTGSGKTIVMTAVIEDILNGTETTIEQPEAIFVWLSDSPQLNEQSKTKIIQKADKIRPNQCVTIEDDSFDQEMLDDGMIYFLNTQKLGKSSRLVSGGDSRTYTVWQTLQNTAEQKGDHLYVIIDEAHRGMHNRDAARATTIMQKFLKGSEADGFEAMPIVIGMSATDERFRRLVGNISSVRHDVDVRPDEVRASGLLKDRIIITYPEQDSIDDMVILQEAADEWKDKCEHWNYYCTTQKSQQVRPVLVIQVENRNSDSASARGDCMFEQFRLKDVRVQYKQNFVSKLWGEEKYKWEAVKWFQDNWDVNAPDFAEMLNCALDKTYNLLASANNFPKGRIVGFAKSATKEVRAMFIALFDESKDVFERMDAFKLQSTVLLEKYGNGAAQHYQYENAISTYLWLRYPDKYYIYKFGEVKTVASELESDYRFKKGVYADNIRNFLKLYDEISIALKADTELVNLLQSQLTDTCYPDPELKTLTIDVGFYISRYYSQKDAIAGAATDWYGTEYDPDLSVDDWSKLLKDESVFTTGALEIMKCIKDYGGMASCTQLAVKYGETKNFYNSRSVALARRVCESTGISPATREDGSTQWWAVLYTGRDAGKDEEGSFIWKLRDELSAALDKADLSDIELYVAAAPGEEDRGYWWLNANPKIWSFSDIAVGKEVSVDKEICEQYVLFPRIF